MTATDGLTTEQAQAALEQHGPNDIAVTTRAGRIRKLLRPVADPMVVLLLVACPAYFALGEPADAVTTLVAIVPIVGIGWFLEQRAEKALAALHHISAPTARVRRDGVWVEIAAREVVPGDVLEIVEGDIAPADGTVAVSTQLSMDESMLTGESVPVTVAVGGAVSAGTVVTNGSALVVTTATGRASALGRISELMDGTTSPRTPLQVAMGRLVLRVAIVAAVATVAVVATAMLRGDSAANALLAGVSLLIAAVPEEFTVVYALYLSLGAWRLAKHRALVRNLPAAEALGSVTVICTDKTGTVTSGRLEVADVHAIGGTQESTTRLLQTAVLASEPRAFDPIDRAIEKYAIEVGIDVDALRAGELVADWPFADNRVTHTWRMPDGSVRVATKGSLEAVAAMTGGGALVDSLGTEHEVLAKAGLRVLAFASASREAPGNDRADDEGGITLDGLIGFLDPLRDGVADALAECATAGIRVVMITGDHPETARAIATQMTGGEVRVATGDDIEAASTSALQEIIATTDVFARTRPHQKQQLVAAMRARGEVVAMTGDGVNDAPALRSADIGVAMGQRGTAVAREAAAIVLLDDSFNAIVAAVRGGRRLYDNLTRAFGYLIAVHLPIIIAAVVAPLLGLPLLLLPIQLVTLEVLLHPIVSLVFQADHAQADIMSRPPRSADFALTWAALRRPVVIGTVLAAVVVATYWTALDIGWDEYSSRSMAFTVLLLSQPPLLLVLRMAQARRGLPRITREFLIACAACIVVAVAGQGLGILRSLNHFGTLPLAAWPIAIGVAFLAVAVPGALVRPRSD